MAWVNLLEILYPDGSTYASSANTSPASLFGGTWQKTSSKGGNLATNVWVKSGNYATDAGPMIPTLAAWNSLSLNYVVEKGTVNNWYYKKWNDNYCECWLKTQVNVTNWDTWGNCFIATPLFTLTLPFTFSTSNIIVQDRLSTGATMGPYREGDSFSVMRATKGTNSGWYELTFYVFGQLATS